MKIKYNCLWSYFKFWLVAQCFNLVCRVSDGTGLSGTTTITISVQPLPDETPVPHIPLNNSIVYITENDETKVATGFNVTFYGTDMDQLETLTYRIVNSTPPEGNDTFHFVQTPTPTSSAIAFLQDISGQYLDYETFTSYILVIE